MSKLYNKNSSKFTTMRTPKFFIMLLFISFLGTGCLKKLHVPQGPTSTQPVKAQVTEQQELAGQIQGIEQEKKQGLEKLGGLLTAFVSKEEISSIQSGDSNRVFENFFKLPRIGITLNDFQANPQHILNTLRGASMGEDYNKFAKYLAALEKDFFKYTENLLVNSINTKLNNPIKTKQDLEKYFTHLKANEKKLSVDEHQHLTLLRTWESLIPVLKQEQANKEAL